MESVADEADSVVAEEADSAVREAQPLASQREASVSDKVAGDEKAAIAEATSAPADATSNALAQSTPPASEARSAKIAAPALALTPLANRANEVRREAHLDRYSGLSELFGKLAVLHWSSRS